MSQVDRTGWICFVKGRGLVSWLIKIFARTKYSHMGIGWGKDFIYEATIPVSKLTRLSKHYKKEDGLRWFKVKGLSYDVAKKAIDEQIHETYDVGYAVKQLLGYMYQIIVRWTFKKIVNNPFEKSKEGSGKRVCGEEVLVFLQKKSIAKIVGENFTEGIDARDPYFFGHLIDRVLESDLLEETFPCNIHIK